MSNMVRTHTHAHTHGGVSSSHFSRVSAAPLRSHRVFVLDLSARFSGLDSAVTQKIKRLSFEPLWDSGEESSALGGHTIPSD